MTSRATGTHVLLAVSAILALFPVVGFTVGIVLQSISSPENVDQLHIVPLYYALLLLALVPQIARYVRPAPTRQGALGANGQWTMPIGALLLAIPVLVGLVFTVQAISQIVS